jgi:hypothetical protein
MTHYWRERNTLRKEKQLLSLERNQTKVPKYDSVSECKKKKKIETLLGNQHITQSIGKLFAITYN